MGMFSGKVAVVMGVANGKSIATSIADFLHKEGAELCYSHLPDDKGRMLARVTQAIGHTNPKLVKACDVNRDEDVQTFFEAVAQQYDRIDYLVHSIAFAPLEDIRNPTVAASRAGFQLALEASVYSFLATAQAASKLMAPGGSMVTLSYFGGEKVVAGYNLMGVAKAALESAVRYAAYDLGPKNIRVNAVSAGPIRTLAASAIGDFGDITELNAAISPMGRTISGEEVAKATGFLLSDLASGVTGEVLHVDAGYHIMGGPGRALERWGIRPRAMKESV